MQLPEHAAHAIRRLERAGFEAWAVGGCVRDSLRGVEPHDWDLCTSASPAQMQAVFADARVLTTGLRHGTLTVLTDGGPLEITTYRTEGGYSDGRHPDGVRFVTDICEDLARRDFTVGAMAWHPERGLCDPFGGQTDLKNGVLRAVGDADTRFRRMRCASCVDCGSPPSWDSPSSRKPPLPCGGRCIAWTALPPSASVRS